MAKHIGIVACSGEGAALCYRTVCTEAPKEMGEHLHPEITMHTHSLGTYMVHIRSGNWDAVADLMLSSARKLVETGAEFLVCPDNTIHQAFDRVEKESPVPWLHIVDSVAQAAKAQSFSCLGIIGTKFLMTGPVYPSRLEQSGIETRIPSEEEREKINEIIFTELVHGVFPEESRLYINEVVQRLKDEGCEAVVLGCTELPLIVDPNDCPLPTLDSTRLLAGAAIRHALE